MPAPSPQKSASFREPIWENKPFLVAAGIVILIVLAALFAVVMSFLPISSGSIPAGIAIIPVKGEITNEAEGFGTLSATEIAGLIKEAEKNPSVGAILLDIDSPGGEVVASKQIVYSVRGSEKPVYSYINSMGASGGYYVAAATDYIMADEDSITGSIGVISIILNVQELLEKIGVKATVLKEGELKAIGSPFTELTEKEEQIIQSILNQAFNNFRDDVLEFRQGRLTRSQLESVPDGRVLTGKQAFEKNLVDELLTRDEALARAAELAGIQGEPEMIEYGEPEFGWFDIFFSSGKAFGAGFVNSINAQSSPQLKIK